MSRVHFPRFTGALDDLPVGQYKRATGDLTKAIQAISRCPACGKTSSLGKGHAVSADGTVTPSYVCPHAPCAFHEWVVFEDWGAP